MSVQKFKNMQSRLKDHFNHLSNHFDGFTITNNDGCLKFNADYTISYVKDNIQFSFLFNYNNKDNEDVNITTQTMKFFYEEKLIDNTVISSISKEFSITEVKYLFSNYFSAVGKDGVAFFAPDKELHIFTLPILLSVFANIEAKSKDLDLFKEVNKHSIQTNENENESNQKRKDELIKAKETFKMEFDIRSSKDMIKTLKEELEGLERSELELEKQLKEKHKITYLTDKTEGLETALFKAKQSRIKNAISLISEKKMSVLFSDVLNQFR